MNSLIKTPVFLTFCMLIVTAILSVHALLRGGVSVAPGFEKRIEHLETEKRRAEFRARLIEDRLAEFQQNVATLLPASLKEKAGDNHAYPLRQLASVQLESDEIQIERASGLMERAKGTFRARDFAKATELFGQVIAKYPDSSHVIEAHFMRAESQYQAHEYEASVATIDRMVDLFPDNELTGFALLRLAGIFESQERIEDAGDIYRAVLANFKQPEIVKQASLSLKSGAL